MCEKNENKQKEAEAGPLLKKERQCENAMEYKIALVKPDASTVLGGLSGKSWKVFWMTIWQRCARKNGFFRFTADAFRETAITALLLSFPLSISCVEVVVVVVVRPSYS